MIVILCMIHVDQLVMQVIECCNRQQYNRVSDLIEDQCPPLLILDICMTIIIIITTTITQIYKLINGQRTIYRKSDLCYII